MKVSHLKIRQFNPDTMVTLIPRVLNVQFLMALVDTHDLKEAEYCRKIYGVYENS